MKTERIWEIDFARFLAIVLMVIFHLSYDLNEFAGLNVNYDSGVLHWVGKISGLLFIFVAGISSGLSKNTVKRGIRVFAFGMLITAATYFFDKTWYIRFGILHFLGIAMILFALLKPINNWILLILSIVLIALGNPVSNTLVNTFLLLPFGFMYANFTSLDYYPLIPYLGVFILGILAYKIIYYKKESIFKFRFNSNIIDYISRHSLAIYILHQPVFLLIIYVLKGFKL